MFFLALIPALVLAIIAAVGAWLGPRGRQLLMDWIFDEEKDRES